MQLFQLKPFHASKGKKRIARGGKRGTTSGRGTKGQKSRAGHRIRPAERDVIKRLPKLRGSRTRGRVSRASAARVPINLGDVNAAFQGGETVSPKALLGRGLISRVGGTTPGVKLLGGGNVTKKLVFEGVTVSASARVKIEKAGGVIK